MHKSRSIIWSSDTSGVWNSLRSESSYRGYVNRRQTHGVLFSSRITRVKTVLVDQRLNEGARAFHTSNPKCPALTKSRR